MSDLLVSGTFWFGAVILCISQIAKFSELNALDPTLAVQSSALPHLRANDFTGRVVFSGTLAAFLAATLLMYIALCALSPGVLSGWAKVTGIADGEAFVQSVPYPLYITAALLGLSQPGVPALSTLGSFQRNLFHSLIGIPKKVLAISSAFTSEIFARSPNAEAIGLELKKLVGDAWIREIGAFADTGFYAGHIVRLGLDKDDQLAEILAGSRRELKTLVGQLVFAASLATVRKSGARGLDDLAEALDVSPPAPLGLVKDLLAGAVLGVVAMTLLWFAIPMLDGFASRHLTGEFDFWPGDLPGSGQSLLSNAVPILISIAIALATWSRLSGAGLSHAVQAGSTGLPADSRTARKRAVFPQIERYAGLFLSLVLVVSVFDLAQALYDFGIFGTRESSAYAFLLNNVPFFILHSFISILCCFVILVFVGRIVEGGWSNLIRTVLVLSVVVAVASGFYAQARLVFQFNRTTGFDLIVLLIMVNVTAALVAFATAALFCRRRMEARQGHDATASREVRQPSRQRLEVSTQ